MELGVWYMRKLLNSNCKINKSMNNRYTRNALIVLFGLLCTSCESYIEFEKMRFKFLVYIFIGTLIVGLIGLVFRDRNNK